MHRLLQQMARGPSANGVGWGWELPGPKVVGPERVPPSPSRSMTPVIILTRWPSMSPWLRFLKRCRCLRQTPPPLSDGGLSAEHPNPAHRKALQLRWSHVRVFSWHS